MLCSGYFDQNSIFRYTENTSQCYYVGLKLVRKVIKEEGNERPVSKK